MNKEGKKEIVETLTQKFEDNNFFYLTNASSLSVLEINKLRRACHEQGVEMKVAKNTLIKRAMEASDVEFGELKDLLTGPTYLMFSPVSNMPAKIIKNFRKTHDMPVIKGAFIDSDIFIGEESLDTLAKLKSREELIGDVILMLQSPLKNVISALQSGRDTLAGLVKTLSERSDKSGEETKTEEVKPEEKEEAKPDTEAKAETDDAQKTGEEPKSEGEEQKSEAEGETDETADKVEPGDKTETEEKAADEKKEDAEEKSDQEMPEAPKAEDKKDQPEASAEGQDQEEKEEKKADDEAAEETDNNKE